LRFAAAIWLASAVTLVFAVTSPAQVISINFNGQGPGTPAARPGPYTLNATDVAGALPIANWNNVPSDNVSTSGLITSTGAATTGSVQGSGMSNGWSLPDTNTAGAIPATPDGTMMRGFLDSGNPSTTPVPISGLPAAFATGRYNVWVYFDGDN